MKKFIIGLLALGAISNSAYADLSPIQGPKNPDLRKMQKQVIHAAIQDMASLSVAAGKYDALNDFQNEKNLEAFIRNKKIFSTNKMQYQSPRLIANQDKMAILNKVLKEARFPDVREDFKVIDAMNRSLSRNPEIQIYRSSISDAGEGGSTDGTMLIYADTINSEFLALIVTVEQD